MPREHIPALDHYQIGLKLRTLRAEKQLTLARLAIETRLSTALLSKLETDRMIPTLQTLSKLCTVYGVSLGYFFSEPTRHNLAISRREHFAPTRASQDKLRHIPLHRDPLGSAHSKANMIEFSEDFMVAASEPGKPLSCLLYVVEGTLRLVVGGTPELLNVGDCACIDTDMTVTWGSGSRDRCQVLMVSVPAE